MVSQSFEGREPARSTLLHGYIFVLKGYCMNLKSASILFLSAFIAVQLSGCGGSDGFSSDSGTDSSSGSTVDNAALPAAPTLAVAFDAKLLKFSWGESDGAETYNIYENGDGGENFNLLAEGLTELTFNYRIAVHKLNWQQALYRVEACNDGGCRLSAEIDVKDAILNSIGLLKANNSGAADSFGSSLAISADGNTIAVGAYLEDSLATGVDGDADSNAAGGSGAAYVFARADDTWTQQAYLKASNTGDFDFFGASVSLSADGNTLAVGAYRESSNATGVNGDELNDAADKAGAAYVFTRSGADWSQQAYLKASNAQASDQFGSAVALSGDGNTLAVAADGEDGNAQGLGGDQSNNAAANSGAVYIFNRNDNVWAQQEYLKSSNTGASDLFGSSLAISSDGNTLAVGARAEGSGSTGVNGEETNNSALSSGAVFVFNRIGSVWLQQAYVKATNTEAADNFGAALALARDGNVLAVGAWGEDSNATGAEGDSSNNGETDSGAVYIYARVNSTWSAEAYVKASNSGSGDRFGASVALSSDGNTLLAGALGEGSNATAVGGKEDDNSAVDSGAAYVFGRNDSMWSQQHYIKASNTDAGDNFAVRVAMSDDGNTLAIGAQGEASNAEGDGNTATGSGAFYLY